MLRVNIHRWERCGPAILRCLARRAGKMQGFMRLRAARNDTLSEESHLVSKKTSVSEAHTTAENLTKPCILDVVSIILNEEHEKKF